MITWFRLWSWWIYESKHWREVEIRHTALCKYTSYIITGETISLYCALIHCRAQSDSSSSMDDWFSVDFNSIHWISWMKCIFEWVSKESSSYQLLFCILVVPIGFLLGPFFAKTIATDDNCKKWSLLIQDMGFLVIIYKIRPNNPDTLVTDSSKPISLLKS